MGQRQTKGQDKRKITGGEERRKEGIKNARDCLPASLLEESKLQRRPLQHGEGCDGDRPARLAGEATL